VTLPTSQPPADITSYVDLRPFDLSDQEMVRTAITYLVGNLPGWTPFEGNTEMLLLEAIALQNSETIVAANRVPGAVVAALLHLAGVDQDYGAPPEATATVTFGDALGHTIPPGTRIYLPLGDGRTVSFLVERPGLTVVPGGTSGTVSLIGDTFTAAANGVPIGTVLVMADMLAWVESVVLATAVSNGRDRETTEEWRDRGVRRLSRLSDALVVVRHFRAAVLELAAVSAAVAIDMWDPTSGHAPSEDAGHITVAVLGDGGTPLSTETKDGIRADLEERAHGSLVVHVIDVALAAVAITSSVVILPGYVFSAVQTSIVSTLQAYFDPLAWTFGTTIYRNELISLIDRVAGVDRVVTVTINGSSIDVTLAGTAVLPKPGVMTITNAGA
jgi:uncharacterized phage protein gp47/JayE